MCQDVQGARGLDDVALMVLEDKLPAPERGQQHGRNVLSEELGPPAQMEFRFVEGRTRPDAP